MSAGTITTPRSITPRVAIAIAVPSIALACLAGPWIAHPIVWAAVAGLAAFYAGARRVVARHGAEGLWLAALAISILGGEVSAISFGGQSGRLLWADVVLGMGAAWALLRSEGRIPIPAAPFVTWLVPFIAWSLLSLLPARDALTGVAELKEWNVAAAVAVIATRFASDAHRARVLLAIVAVTGALIALHMFYVVATSPFGPVLAIVLKKVDLPWGRTNYLAGLLILALPVTLGLLGHARRAAARTVWATLLVLQAGGVVVSASKGAILALVAGLALAFLQGGRVARVGLAVMAAVIGVGVLTFTIGPLHDVLAYRLQESALQYSMGERMDLYQLSWDEFVKHPVLGIGLNNFSVSSNRLTGVDTVPHNFQLGFLAELGLVGFLIACAWMWAVGASAHRARRTASTGPERALALGLWGAFLAFAIHNQFESTIYGEQFKILLVLVAAAAWRLGQERPEPSEQSV